MERLQGRHGITTCNAGLLNEDFLQAKEEAKKKDEAASKDREAALLKAQDDAKRRQEEAAHNDAVSGFQTLLAELVKDPYAQWKVDQHHMLSPTMLTCRELLLIRIQFACSCNMCTPASHNPSQVLTSAARILVQSL